MITVGMTMTDVNWANVISVSAVAGLISMLTSVATGLPEVDMQVPPAQE
jgi:transcription antitermination factor NusG